MHRKALILKVHYGVAMRRIRAVEKIRKDNEKYSSNKTSDAISEFLDAKGYSNGKSIQELLKEFSEFIADGHGNAISSTDTTDAGDALAKDRQHQREIARDESASLACQSSDPESCLSRVLRVPSTGTMRDVGKKAERCIEDNKPIPSPELTFVHAGDDGNRLVELVRLLARRAARMLYEERKEDQCCRRKP